jgi:ferrochelatase
MEGREAFMHAGGEAFSYIPCLNDSPAWITALAGIAEHNLAGWPTQAPLPCCTCSATPARTL